MRATARCGARWHRLLRRVWRMRAPARADRGCPAAIARPSGAPGRPDPESGLRLHRTGSRRFRPHPGSAVALRAALPRCPRRRSFPHRAHPGARPSFRPPHRQRLAAEPGAGAPGVAAPCRPASAAAQGPRFERLRPGAERPAIVPQHQARVGWRPVKRRPVQPSPVVRRAPAWGDSQTRPARRPAGASALHLPQVEKRRSSGAAAAPLQRRYPRTTRAATRPAPREPPAPESATIPAPPPAAQPGGPAAARLAARSNGCAATTMPCLSGSPAPKPAPAERSTRSAATKTTWGSGSDRRPHRRLEMQRESCRRGHSPPAPPAASQQAWSPRPPPADRTAPRARGGAAHRPGRARRAAAPSGSARGGMPPGRPMFGRLSRRQAPPPASVPATRLPAAWMLSPLLSCRAPRPLPRPATTELRRPVHRLPILPGPATPPPPPRPHAPGASLRSSVGRAKP